MSRVDLFCRRARHAATSPAAALEAALDALLERANGPSRALHIDEERFLGFVAERLRPEGDAIEQLRELSAADLLLTCACAEGEPHALKLLDEELVRICRAVAATSRADADELAQLLRSRLLVGTAEEPAKIGEYAGRGSLGSWLRMAALRIHLNQQRGSRQEAVEPEEIARLAGPGRDIELDYIHARYRREFRSALADAFRALDKRERNLLRFQCVEALSADQIGRVYHVSRATAARWLADARGKLVDETRRRLAPVVEASELGGLITLLGSHLDMTLSSIFRTRP